MSSVSSIANDDLTTTIPDPSSWKGRAGRAWVALENLAERFNPILVKETRQALKSRQFLVTFIVVLIACWVANFAVVMIVGPDVYFVAAGAQMLLVYAVILAFPLFLIVPYSAFRSLAAEQEDNTYDLLSITTLTTGQIVTGKLASAIVQMLVFLSAVSPCIAFTFLLRGVDVLTVAVLLGYLILTSLGLSIIALLAGTMAKVRYSQVLVSVLLVLMLAGVFFMSMPLMEEFISDSYSYLRDGWFWVGNLAFLTVYVTTFALLHAAASAQIAFTSQNRSTPLRRIMMLQTACWFGWLAVPVIDTGWREFNMAVFIAAIVAGIYWYFMGSLLTSEWPHLSRRVQRSLPQSELGRTFLPWLNPGPGTGYMLCVAYFTMITVVGLLALVIMPNTRRFGPNQEQLFFFFTIGWSYVVLYLGVGKLLIGVMRRFAFVSLTAGFLLHIILLLAGCGVPQILSYMTSTRQFNNEYTLLHITNPIWTLIELIDGGAMAMEAWTVLIVIGSAAIIVLLLNMRAVAVELQYQRAVLPERVAEDEAQLHPEPIPGPANPWEAEADA